MTTSEEKSARTCPLCAGDNACAMADGKGVESCWCLGATLDRAALATTGPESPSRHCLCARCGGALTETAYDR